MTATDDAAAFGQSLTATHVECAERKEKRNRQQEGSLGDAETVNLTKLSDDDLARLEDIFGSLAGRGDDDAPDQGGEGEAGTPTHRP
jgi:hypothetical protein